MLSTLNLVLFHQELSRILIYFLFKKADTLLRKLTENEGTRIFANKHILSYGKAKLYYYELFINDA